MLFGSDFNSHQILTKLSSTGVLNYAHDITHPKVSFPNEIFPSYGVALYIELLDANGREKEKKELLQDVSDSKIKEIYKSIL